jgi:hypothetical protein
VSKKGRVQSIILYFVKWCRDLYRIYDIDNRTHFTFDITLMSHDSTAPILPTRTIVLLRNNRKT